MLYSSLHIRGLNCDKKIKGCHRVTLENTSWNLFPSERCGNISCHTVRPWQWYQEYHMLTQDVKHELTTFSVKSLRKVYEHSIGSDRFLSFLKLLESVYKNLGDDKGSWPPCIALLFWWSCRSPCLEGELLSDCFRGSVQITFEVWQINAERNCLPGPSSNRAQKRKKKSEGTIIGLTPFHNGVKNIVSRILH